MANKKRYKNRNRGNGANPMQENRHFASVSAIKNTSSTSSATSITESRLKAMLRDPQTNGVQIAGLSKNMKQVNGAYKRIIKYLSSLLTYDHVLYPVMQDPLQYMEDPATLQLEFAQTAIFLDRLNPKFNLPMITEKMFTNGSVFLYKLEDSKSVAYQEMPISFCRIGYLDQGVYRYQFDVTKIQEATLLNYPKELQSAYTSYKNGATDKLIEGKWYQVGDKGVAFTLDSDALTQNGFALPPLANALVDVIKIENAKDGMESTAELDNTKIVHSRIETDDKGRPLMELPVVLEYHNSLKRNLPDGSVAITNPFETKALSLNGTGKDGKFALLDKSVEQLYEGAGVSKLLFAGDGTSSQALERSIQVDAQWLYSFLLPMFANYYNYELLKAGKKGTTWKVKFLQMSHFDREAVLKLAKDNLANGGSRTEYLGHCGMTPIEIVNMLVFEQRILTIDDLMIAKQTSYTMSGDEGEAGAPESDDPTDTTTRIKDSQQ
ncbi:hypothetical protein ACW5UC_25190 [Priestia aryabhattai]|uniref:hypothetical protein n=1 Tax=Priestia megaterium TaxID=1404 RepID=UPI003F9B2760